MRSREGCFAAAVAEWRGGGNGKSKSNNNAEEGTGMTATAPTVGAGQWWGDCRALSSSDGARGQGGGAGYGRKMAALTAKLEEARRQAVISSTKAGGAGAGGSRLVKGGLDDSLDSITTANANDLSFSYVHETRPVNHGPAIGLTPREGDAGAAALVISIDL